MAYIDLVTGQIFGGVPSPIPAGTAATYAALPAKPQGQWFVRADETKGGAPTLYYFDNGHQIWCAAVQEF